MISQFCSLFAPFEALLGVEKDDKEAVVSKNKVVENAVVGDDDSDDLLLSPYIRYDDGYQWPDLYEEIDNVIEKNVLIYAIAELREMARNDKTILMGKQALELPLTHAQLMDVVEANQKSLEEMQFGKAHVQDVLRTTEERNMIYSTQRQISPETIIAFDDEFAEEELVYMVEVSASHQRVTITFRGSVTKMDWATNFELYMKEVDNPMKNHATQEDTVRIHNGFYDYMFQPNLRGVRGPNGESLSEFQEIFQEHLLPVLKKYPGYKLYVTGHSLGGALATIFAFGAAALPDEVVPKPISLFTLGAPYVGDDSFADSFQLQESLGRLRCCRVANQRDYVTCVPKMAFRWNIFAPKSHVGALFKHVGMAVRLYEGTKPFDVIYRRKREGKYSSFWDEMARGWDQTLFTQFDWNLGHYRSWPWHKLCSYNDRLQANEEVLRRTYLNDLYARPEHVGKLVPQF